MFKMKKTLYIFRQRYIIIKAKKMKAGVEKILSHPMPLRLCAAGTKGRIGKSSAETYAIGRKV